MASGIARGAKARGKRIAFGDGQQIRWHPYAKDIFKNNPNVAPPGSENDPDIEWVAHYAGKRLYNEQGNGKWIWKPFKPIPGEIFFDHEELDFGKQFGSGFIVIEPGVPRFKSVAINKQWPRQRWQIVCDRLLRGGYEVKQFAHSGEPILHGAKAIKTQTFRQALAVLQHAKLFIGHEGGMHHGAAAVGVPAVVLFGGFIHPRTTGYDFHANIFTGGEEGCGSIKRCEHCLRAMRAITPEMVLSRASKFI